MTLIQIYRSDLVATRMKNRRKNITMLPVEIPLMLPRGSAQSTASYSEYPRRRRLKGTVYGDMIITMMSTSTGLSGKWMNLHNGSQFDVRDWEEDQDMVTCGKPPPDGAVVHIHTVLGVCYWINHLLVGDNPLYNEYP